MVHGGEHESKTADLSDASFDLFFKAAFARAVGVAQRVTGERASAEDAAIDALAKAHYRWKRIGSEPWRDLWVMRVAVNEAIRRLPKTALGLPSPRGEEDPSDAVSLRVTLTSALTSLPQRQCEVIVLRYLVGLSEDEVARTLRISQGTVKTHLRRGLSKLRNTVGHSLKEEHLARLA